MCSSSSRLQLSLQYLRDHRSDPALSAFTHRAETLAELRAETLAELRAETLFIKRLPADETTF